MTKIYPQHDKILVEPEKESDKTDSGIIVPDKETKWRIAKVIAVGPGMFNSHGMRDEMSVSEGETVVISTYGFEKVEIRGEEYCFIDDNDVIAVIE